MARARNCQAARAPDSESVIAHLPGTVPGGRCSASSIGIPGGGAVNACRAGAMSGASADANPGAKARCGAASRFLHRASRRSLGAMRLKMCSIHVKDPASAHEFYTGTLGFETLMAMPEYNLFIVKDPDGAGGAGLLLEPSDNS